MKFDEWWTRHGKWQPIPEGGKYEIMAKLSWDVVTARNKRAQVSRFFLAVFLGILVLCQAFQNVAFLDLAARLDVLEAPPEIVHPYIAIDPLAAESPMIYARHKVSLKYKTRAIYAAHNEEVHNDSN